MQYDTPLVQEVVRWLRNMGLEVLSIDPSTGVLTVRIPKA